VSAAVGDAGELLDVDVDQLTEVAGLDPADHSSRGPVQPPQPVDAVADQDPVHRRRRDIDDAGQAGWAETDWRNATIRRSTRAGVWCGHERGRLDRSRMPSKPSGQNRPHHLWAV